MAKEKEKKKVRIGVVGVNRGGGMIYYFFLGVILTYTFEIKK